MKSTAKGGVSTSIGSVDITLKLKKIYIYFFIFKLLQKINIYWWKYVSYLMPIVNALLALQIKDINVNIISVYQKYWSQNNDSL